MNNYFRVKAKEKKQNTKLKAVLVVIAALIVFYALVFPSHLGILGRFFKKYMSLYLGQGMFLVPVFLFIYGFELFKSRKPNLIQLGLSILVILLGTVSLSVISKINYGGIIGLFFKINLFERLFGEVGTVLVLIAGIFISFSVLFNVSLIEMARKLRDIIVSDIQEWERARESKRNTETTRAPLPAQFRQKIRAEKLPVAEEDKPKTAPADNIKIKADSGEDAKKRREQPPAAAGDKQKKEPKKQELPPSSQGYTLPSLDLLTTPVELDKEYSQDSASKAALLEQTLASFNVHAKVTDVSSGPVITRFDLTPDPGVKVQQITVLENDIALAMKATHVRIVAPVPGKGAVGVEIPNVQTKMVGIREIMSTEEFQKSSSKLAMALGQTTEGIPFTTDLAPMPHLLIAGATGSGKSVCIHSILVSMLYKARPDEVKFMLIDPKRLELPIYDGLPHLYDPKTTSGNVKVITKPKEASESLKYLVKVMEKRYEEFAKATVRNIEGYNDLMEKQKGRKEFYIVVIIDELADLMLTCSKEVEDSIQRLAQMARAVGIHLILATQRPSVDVITGVIKANLSSRISFQVLSKTDSRVILDTMGAENLLGRGDMLFLPTGAPKPVRLQGAYVSEKEVEKIVEFIKNQKFAPEYEDLGFLRKEEKTEKDEKMNVYLVEALELILERRRVSQDLLKAKFGSSAKASDVLSVLEVKGFIEKPEGTNRWTILFDKVEEYIQNQKNP